MAHPTSVPYQFLALSGDELLSVYDEAFNRERSGTRAPTMAERTSTQYQELQTEIHKYVADGTATARTGLYTSMIKRDPSASTSPDERAKEVINSTIGPAVEYYSHQATAMPDVRVSSRLLSCAPEREGNTTMLFYDHQSRVKATSRNASNAAGASQQEWDEMDNANKWANKVVREREEWEAENGFAVGTKDHIELSDLYGANEDDTKKSSTGRLPSETNAGTATEANTAL
ncbi:hypothetical protein I317_02196 [Kwoniella heveanensis CBS 569]|nr:hypothetical protein I317_02196 [Kwoniella heveanensis CBS 569]